MFNTEVVAVEGDGSLERVRWRSRLYLPHDVHSFDIRNMFLFVGADPATGWLRGLRRDARPRRQPSSTGAQSELDPGPSGAAALETSVPGVFAVGEERSLGSVKRVGGAIGEERAPVVAALHGYLADAVEPAL